MADKVSIRVFLRDISSELVASWNDPQAFGTDKYKGDVQVSRYLSQVLYNHVQINMTLCGHVLD